MKSPTFKIICPPLISPLYPLIQSSFTVDAHWVCSAVSRLGHDGSVSGPWSGPYGVEGAAGQWEPTLAALLLRQSPGTDGARLGWDPGQGRVPAMKQPLIYAAAPDRGPGVQGGGGAPSAQLTPAGCRVIYREGRGGGYDKWVSEKGWFGHPWGPASSSGPLVSCRICAACVQRGQPVKHISF